MLTLRQLHRYLGVFFTPAIVFFAFSGALQTLDLHKGAHRGEAPAYPWIATMAAIHKDQRLAKPHAVAAPAVSVPAATTATAAAGQPAMAGSRPGKQAQWPLKVFVLVLAAGLCLSSLAGLFIALSNPRVRGTIGLTLAAGTVLPLLLLLV